MIWLKGVDLNGFLDIKPFMKSMTGACLGNT